MLTIESQKPCHWQAILRIGESSLTAGLLADVSAVQLRGQFFAPMRVDEHLSAGVSVMTSPSRHVGTWNRTTG
ncbi:MAG TPA: hypothetical protein VII34_13810 [Pyrinomonadaceae bacterium]